MAHRVKKNSVGVHKPELRNEPMKFLVSPYEEALINSQCQTYANCSEYLRYLILEKSQYTKTITTPKTVNLIQLINKLGQQLNNITKKANISLLNREIINFNDESDLFVEIIGILNRITDRTKVIIAQKNQERNIQIKFLVTPTELKQIKKKLKLEKKKFSAYMRQQITGYEEKEFKNKSIEISRAIGRLANNINQLLNAIRIQERTKGIVLINQETRQSIIKISQTIKELQVKLK